MIKKMFFKQVSVLVLTCFVLSNTAYSQGNSGGQSQTTSSRPTRTSTRTTATTTTVPSAIPTIATIYPTVTGTQGRDFGNPNALIVTGAVAGAIACGVFFTCLIYKLKHGFCRRMSDAPLNLAPYGTASGDLELSEISSECPEAVFEVASDPEVVQEAIQEMGESEAAPQEIEIRVIDENGNIVETDVKRL
jgi:hypothetical protein